MDQTNEVQLWLMSLPASPASSEAVQAWDEFAQNTRPVVTFFGSYDTGKSSLLRRLVVDGGETVPDWLTISARHETFENNAIEVGECLLRDTPGFAVGAVDGRGESNSARALEAVGLTDIAIAVLTPQLVTSDRDLFQSLLDQNWPPGSLWFVISRFDESGGDPEYDRPGYEQLGEQKIAELRELFSLDPAVPIHVVAQDPFQEAGPDSTVPPAVWDQYREWDGMEALSNRLRQVTPRSLPELRSAAADRYWNRAVAATLDTLRADLAACEDSALVAKHGVARRDAWENELGAIDKAAQASLDGLVESVVDRWLALPHTPLAQLQTQIESSLTLWFTQNDAHLQRLQRSINKAVERDHRQPAWDGFASLVADLQDAPQQAAQSAAKFGDRAEQVEEIGNHVLRVMKAFAREGDPQRKAAANATRAAAGNKAAAAGEKAPQTGGPGLGQYISAAEAALPLAIYVAGLIDEQKQQDSVATTATPDPAKRDTVVEACTNQGRDAWKALVDQTRTLIDNETRDQVSLDAELREAVAELRSAIASGENLLDIGG